MKAAFCVLDIDENDFEKQLQLQLLLLARLFKHTASTPSILFALCEPALLKSGACARL